jgi:hypothetical protein
MKAFISLSRTSPNEIPCSLANCLNGNTAKVTLCL